MRRMSQQDSSHPVTEASLYLRALAGRIAAIYAAHTPARAAVLVGSASTGGSDEYSDIDMGPLYDTLPSDTQLDAARDQVIRDLGAVRLPRTNGDWYLVDGIYCQVALATLDAVDRHLDRALSPDFQEGDQKALSGWLHAIALFGEDIVEARRRRVAVYPEELAGATVRRYLHFQPLWLMPGYHAARDAALWFHHAAAENCLHVLGVLAGINCVYYSTFQFKRMQAFIDTLSLKPPDLAGRIERLLADVIADPPAAARELEALVAETVALVERHMPEIDVTDAKRYLGERQQPWQPQHQN